MIRLASGGALTREPNLSSHDAIEFALAHHLGGELERAYSRAILQQRRRELMQKWSDLLTRLARKKQGRPRQPKNTVSGIGCEESHISRYQRLLRDRCTHAVKWNRSRAPRRRVCTRPRPPQRAGRSVSAG